MADNSAASGNAHAAAFQIDDIDETIIAILEQDGRATLAQLSEATGLSVSAVQSRVQKLERKGVILGYRAVIDNEKRGLGITAYVSVTPTDYAQESRIPDMLRDLDGVISCDSVTGSSNYLLTVRAGSPAALEELVDNIRCTVSANTETTVVLKRYFSK
jgi:Lrp/AsnC family transcriptional regulator, leucine-responsive regulatory protein